MLDDYPLLMIHDYEVMIAMVPVPPALALRKGRVLVAAAAVALLAGCGSAAAPQSAGTTGGATSASRTQSARTGQPISASTSMPASAAAAAAGSSTLTACRTAWLRVAVNPRQAGGTAGSVYYPLDFTNRSRSACGMYGYPGISFVTARGTASRQIGAAAQRNPAFGKLTVRLAAGGVAHAWLQVAQAGNYPAASCQPVKAHWLRVFAPGQTVAGFVNYSFDACASAKVPLLTVMPVRAGQGIQGRTP
jgi:hypothetical protein